MTIEHHIIVPTKDMKKVPLLLQWAIEWFGFSLMTHEQFNLQRIEAGLMNVDIDRMKKLAGASAAYSVGPTGRNFDIDIEAALDSGILPRADEDNIETLIEKRDVALTATA